MQSYINLGLCYGELLLILLFIFAGIKGYGKLEWCAAVLASYDAWYVSYLVASAGPSAYLMHSRAITNFSVTIMMFGGFVGLVICFIYLLAFFYVRFYLRRRSPGAV